MATAKEVLLSQFRSGQGLIEQFTADLSDAEYFKPPISGGNHAGWILGHIACSEDAITSQLTGGAKRLPEAMHALFKGGTACLADAGEYPSRRQIDEMFKSSRAHTVEELTRFDEKTWTNPSPAGWEKSPFKTVGDVWGLQGTHQFWHLGQLTVCRAALGKKRALGT